jgi:hypothetical protein
MSMERPEKPQSALHWLELKTAWETWQAGGRMPALSEGTQAYFEALSFQCINATLKTLSSAFPNVPPMRDGKEAWAHVFRELVEERPHAARRIIDDIFIRAREKAGLPEGLTPLDELTHLIGWIINQFQMRVRDVARAYACDHGSQSLASVTDSLNRPLSSGDGQVTLLDILTFMDPNWATAVEREELRHLGEGVVKEFFPGVRPAFKLRLYLRMLRDQRDVIISVANKIVLALAGVQKAVFAEGSTKVLEKLTAEAAGSPAYQELDREARLYFLGYTAMSLADRTEMWTHLGECVGEFLEQNAKAADKGRVAPDVLITRLEDFAGLLLNELRKKGALLSENELAPLFTAIAAARQQHSA